MSLRIDGKKISSDIKEELKEQVKLLEEEGISVCLAVIQQEVNLHQAYM